MKAKAWQDEFSDFLKNQGDADNAKQNNDD